MREPRGAANCAVVVAGFVILCGAGIVSPRKAVPRPNAWAVSQLISPAELLKQISPAQAHRLLVVCVGYRVLYQGAHIRGAAYEGPTSQPSGMQSFRRWSLTVPKGAKVVIYCGCCPFDRCPNVRPALEALRSEGFTHVRVLYLPHSFASDWVEKGYPAAGARLKAHSN
jgi:thiosulfate/3-mercaptopyruvate sulfurtransferase